MLMLIIPPVLRVIKTLFLLLESDRFCQQPGSCVSLTCKIGKSYLNSLFRDIIHIPQNSEIESVHVGYIQYLHQIVPPSSQSICRTFLTPQKRNPIHFNSPSPFLGFSPSPWLSWVGQRIGGVGRSRRAVKETFAVLQGLMMVIQSMVAGAKGVKNCLNRRCIFKVVPIGFPDQLHLPGGFADEFSIRCVRMR